MISSSGSGLLVALLLVPVLGALVVAFLRDNDRLAKQTALGFAVVELVVAIVSWIERTYHRRSRQRALGKLADRVRGSARGRSCGLNTFNPRVH